MRIDYWKTSAPLRLPATKALQKKLTRIQREFFPSFSQSSVIKILFGVFAKEHGLRPTLARAAAEQPLEANGTVAVEIVDCTEDDLRLILGCNWLVTNGKKTRAQLLS